MFFGDRSTLVSNASQGGRSDCFNVDGGSCDSNGTGSRGSSSCGSRGDVVVELPT